MSRVLIIGAGGLGCPASLELAKQGVRSITLIDPDVVDPTNLHRQPWHRTSDIGRPKVDSAAEKLRAAFPKLEVHALRSAVDHHNALELFSKHELAIDATDGVLTKFLLSDASVKTAIPLIYGGVLRMQGQLMAIAPGGPCLRCLFEAPPAPDAIPTCAQAGVLGAMAGLIGGLQAALALELLEGKAVAGKLRSFDAVTLRMRELTVKKRPDCPACSMPSVLKLKPVEEMACAI